MTHKIDKMAFHPCRCKAFPHSVPQQAEPVSVEYHASTLLNPGHSVVPSFSGQRCLSLYGQQGQHPFRNKPQALIAPDPQYSTGILPWAGEGKGKKEKKGIFVSTVESDHVAYRVSLTTPAHWLHDPRRPFFFLSLSLSLSRDCLLEL